MFTVRLTTKPPRLLEWIPKRSCETHLPPAAQVQKLRGVVARWSGKYNMTSSCMFFSGDFGCTMSDAWCWRADCLFPLLYVCLSCILVCLVLVTVGCAIFGRSLFELSLEHVQNLKFIAGEITQTVHCFRSLIISLPAFSHGFQKVFLTQCIFVTVYQGRVLTKLRKSRACRGTLPRRDGMGRDGTTVLSRHVLWRTASCLVVFLEDRSHFVPSCRKQRNLV